MSSVCACLVCARREDEREGSGEKEVEGREREAGIKAGSRERDRRRRERCKERKRCKEERESSGHKGRHQRPRRIMEMSLLGELSNVKQLEKRSLHGIHIAFELLVQPENVTQLHSRAQ